MIENILKMLADQQHMVEPDDDLTKMLREAGITADSELYEEDLFFVQAAMKQHELPEDRKKDVH